MTTAEYPDTTWLGPPRAYGTGRDGKAVRLSVVHYTAGASGPGTARAGAAYDKRRTDGTSCHCFHDSAESVQEVWTKDRSNSAFGKGNRLGIHHELCSTLQPRSWWLTGVGLATLARAARASAWDCKTYNLEPRWLSVSEVRAAWYSFPNGPRGICGHVDITRAFPEDGGTHTDPGDGFPRDVYIAKVREFLTPTTLQGDSDMGIVIQKNTPNAKGGVDMYWVWSDGIRWKPLITWPDVLWHCALRGQQPGTYTIVDQGEFERRAGRQDDLVDPLDLERAAAVTPDT